MHTVLIGAVLFRLAFAPLLPVLSDDMFRYVWDGWLQWEGINPYHFSPDDPALAAFHELPIFDKLNSASYYSVYPPLSQLIFAVGGWLHEVDWRLSFYVIKAVFLGLEGVSVWLLTRLTSARNVLLYAWNPLVLVEVAGQTHSEAALVLFLVAAVWAVRHDRGRMASLSIAGAGLVKLYPLVLGPFLLRRYGWRAVWPGALLAIVVCAPYAAPYVVPHLKASVDLYFELFEFNAAPYYLVKEAFYDWTGQDWSKTIGPAFRRIFLLSLPALYAWDAWKEWRFERAALVTLGLFFVLSTTVHPWYLLAVVPLAVLGSRPSWHWLWLGVVSMGTYLYYVDGPYWNWVWAAWGGALVLLLASRADRVLQWVQRRRAEQKVDRIEPFLRDLVPKGAPISILDLGAGEGYVGRSIEQRLDAEVTLVDVVDLNRTDQPVQLYDGHTLPYEDDAFDVTILYYVLHHCADPGQVLSEALRVSDRGVLIAESVPQSEGQRRVLRILDVLANRLRSMGAMSEQEEHLSFRRIEEWEQAIRARGGHIAGRVNVESWIHPQVIWWGQSDGSEVDAVIESQKTNPHNPPTEASSTSTHR